jgi:hypothetical protein
VTALRKSNASTRGVMSLWTRTPMFRVERGPLLIQTLATCLASQAFAETQFVTDQLGAEIATRLGWPFAEIVTPLEDWPADGLTHIWALGKLVACAIQDRPFVQFDGDVLLFRRLPERLTRCRLVAQSPDNPHFYTSRDMRTVKAVAGFAEGVTAFNGGLLGGRDVALMRAYAWAGLDLAQKFCRCPITGTVISMVIEQYQLGVFSRRVGVEVGTLLSMHPTHTQVSRAGYAHLSGNAKRQQKWVMRAEERLSRDFPEAYERFNAAWPWLASLPCAGPREQGSSSAEVTAIQP